MIPHQLSRTGGDLSSLLWNSRCAAINLLLLSYALSGDHSTWKHINFWYSFNIRFPSRHLLLASTKRHTRLDRLDSATNSLTGPMQIYTTKESHLCKTAAKALNWTVRGPKRRISLRIAHIFLSAKSDLLLKHNFYASNYQSCWKCGLLGVGVLVLVEILTSKWLSWLVLQAVLNNNYK